MLAWALRTATSPPRINGLPVVLQSHRVAAQRQRINRVAAGRIDSDLTGDARRALDKHRLTTARSDLAEDATGGCLTESQGAEAQAKRQSERGALQLPSL